MQTLMYISKPFVSLTRFIYLQTKERFAAALFPQEGALSSRWLLLEEAQGWKDNTRRSHEAESARNRGKYL